MAKRHGITKDTYGKLLLDAGAIYTDFEDLNNPGTLLGATRGGAVFKREPKYADLRFEGMPGPVMGQRHLIDVKVTLEVNIISFDKGNLALSIPNAELSETSDDYTRITESAWDSGAVHTLNNVALIARLSGNFDPVIIILDNPIAEKGLSFSFQDKGEASSKWVFGAYYKYDEESGFSDAPWRILWPGIHLGFVAISSSAATAHSPDGKTWAREGDISASVYSWSDIIFGGGRFVAIANLSNQAAYSLDGLAWNMASVPSSRRWVSAAHGKGLFVAVSYLEDYAMYSNDGASWTEISLPAMPDGYTSVSYGKDKFIAVGYNTELYAYSYDGMTWIQASLPSGGGSLWAALGYGGGLYITMARFSSQFAYSADGISWTAGALPGTGKWESRVAYGNGVYVTLDNESPSSNYIYSFNGVDWVFGTLPDSQYWIQITFGNGVFVIVAKNSNLAAYSADGINWTLATLPLSTTWESVAY